MGILRFIPEIKMGCISDVGNSYYYSNWGASGFLNRFPEMNPKPSYVAVATMTRVLDGARFVRDVPVPSPSVYALEFDRPDGLSLTDEGYISNFRFGSQQSITRNWHMPMHQTDTLFHKQKTSMSKAHDKIRSAS